MTQCLVDQGCIPSLLGVVHQDADDDVLANNSLLIVNTLQIERFDVQRESGSICNEHGDPEETLEPERLELAHQSLAEMPRSKKIECTKLSILLRDKVVNKEIELKSSGAD